MLIQIMIELNDVQSGNVVIGATNAPPNLDPAIRSRLARNYLIDLLEKPERIQFFKQMLSGT